MDGCLFCKIARKEIPSTVIYEDEKFLAFLDIMPANKGHALVIPKEHHETYTDLPVELARDLSEVVQKIASAICKTTSAQGFNVFINNKKAAGQVVPHAHFHIVPRFQGDGIRFDWPKKKYDEGEAAKLTMNIKNFL